MPTTVPSSDHTLELEKVPIDPTIFYKDGDEDDATGGVEENEHQPRFPIDAAYVDLDGANILGERLRSRR